MFLLQLFLSYFCGLMLLLVLAGVFNITNKLYLTLTVSSIVSGVLLFVFSAIGYKFVVVSPAAFFVCGFFGGVGLLAVIALKLIL